jgi:hypothetical protein
LVRPKNQNQEKDSVSEKNMRANKNKTLVLSSFDIQEFCGILELIGQ